MRSKLWQRLAVGTATVALATSLSFAASELLVARDANPQAAQIFDPKVTASAHCAGGGGVGGNSLMRALSEIGMASIAEAKTKPKEVTPDVPLWPGLGTITFPVTTKNPLVQQYFDQGLRLAYGFNHPEAVRSFRQAQALDPSCAMCFWGEAYAFGPNINLEMQDDAVAPAYAAITKAQALASKASAKEQALIAAMAARYAAQKPQDRHPLDQAYADAMAGVAKTYADDPDVLTLYAEALMDLRPWDYWKAGGIEPYPEEAALVPTLEHGLALSPNHAGLLHLYIHALEATPNAKKAEAAADRLEPLMPAAGHIVHMPGHIYMRIGRQADSIKVNLAAIEADEKFIKARGDAGFYALAYYPHNVHFVLVSAELAGDLDTMRAMAKKLDPLIPPEILAQVPVAQPVKAAPMLALAQIGDEESVMAIDKPGDNLPYLLDMWHYARGLIFARKGDAKSASAELAEMEKISASGALDKFPPQFLPAAQMGKIAEELVRGRIAEAHHKNKEAIVHLQKAADLQSALPYTEPPFWYYPIKQSLGGLLLATGKAKQASDIFRASLLEQPGNAWALYGLMKSYEKMHDPEAAEETKKHFDEDWLGKPEAIDIKWM